MCAARGKPEFWYDETTFPNIVIFQIIELKTTTSVFDCKGSLVGNADPVTKKSMKNEFKPGKNAVYGIPPVHESRYSKHKIFYNHGR